MLLEQLNEFVFLVSLPLVLCLDATAEDGGLVDRASGSAVRRVGAAPNAGSLRFVFGGRSECGSEVVRLL